MSYLRYALVHLATTVGLVGLYALVRWAADFDIVSSIFPILPSMIAAMVLGADHARATGKVPENLAAWRFAAVATAISVLLLACSYFVLAALYPAFIETLLTETGRAILGPTLLGIGVVLIFFANRLFLSIHAKTTLKALAKRGPRP